jgi:hypothetical protein
MNNLIQSALTAMLASGLLVPMHDFAVSSSPSSASDVILEVVATYNGMWCAQCADTYTYLRVYSDGVAEWQPSTLTAAKPKENPITKTTLTQDQLVRIKSAVNAPKLTKIKARYTTLYDIVDSSTTWTIKIPRSGQIQTIEVLEFSPALTKTMKHPYPDALVKLGCNLKNLRVEVSGEHSTLDSECQRVLGTADRTRSNQRAHGPNP